MTDSSDGVVETMFKVLGARDWDALSMLLATDLERIGQFGDRVEGRDAFVHFMKGADQPTSDYVPQRTAWDVHSVAYTEDRRTAFARVTARIPRNDGGRELRIEETLAYRLDENGLIARIEVFWRDPRS